VRGEPIFYGDASQEDVLRHAHIEAAKVVVVAIPDAAATGRITELARRINPTARLIIRTRFLQEVERLYELGATEVIPEEFETSIEIFTRVLNHFSVPEEQIEEAKAEIRAESYRIFRIRSATEDLQARLDE